MGLVTRKTAKHTNGKVEQKGWPQQKVMHTKRDRPNSGVRYNQRPYTQRGSGQTVVLVTRKKAMHTKRDRPNSGVSYKGKGPDT